MQRAQSVRHAHYDVDATITPETRFKVSLVQLCGIVAAVFFVAVGYVYLVYGLSSARTDVADIKATQTAAINSTSGAIKDQDDKRNALGKQLVDSNEKIAAAVNQLTTQMVVQQERQKSTDDKLERVLAQIGAKLDQQPSGRR